MQLEQLRSFWAKVLGTNGPQWMIVMALQRLDEGRGATVEAVAELLQANPGFVTSRSRLLESKGLIRVIAAGEDDAAIMLALTDSARRHLAELASLQER